MSLDNYFRMTGGKTAALVEAALAVGALLGTGDQALVRSLAEFGLQFGLAFQARDDFLGIWGEPALTGKPVGSDILQGKRSLPIVHALERNAPDTAAGERLRGALRERDVAAVLAILERSGTQGIRRGGSRSAHARGGCGAGGGGAHCPVRRGPATLSPSTPWARA